MEQIKLSIDLAEMDAQTAYQAHLAYLDEHMPERDKSDEKETLDNLAGKVFYRTRVGLNDKTMQLESPIGDPSKRRELLATSINRAWEAVAAEAFPPSEEPLITLLS